MTTKGRPLAKVGYETELESIQTFLALQNKSDNTGSSAQSQAEIKPEDLVGPHILKKHKSKKVSLLCAFFKTKHLIWVEANDLCMQ